MGANRGEGGEERHMYGPLKHRHSRASKEKLGPKKMREAERV